MRFIGRAKSDVALPIEMDASVAFPRASFHDSLAFYIRFMHLFGIMPLEGMEKRSADEVKFQWKTFKFFYTLYHIFGGFVMAIFCIAKFAIDGLRLDKTAPASFYFMNFFGGLAFINLARHWPLILKEWSYVEMSMRSYGAIKNLKRRFKIMTVIFMTLSLVEHLLFVLNAVFASKMCANFWEYQDEIYFGIAFPSVFTIISYSPWKACLVELTNVLCTVMWNCTDLFVILVSCALAVRFSQIAKRLQNNRVMHERFWKEIREDYNKLAHLCHVVDKYLAPLVMVSFVNNTFFICVQLYNSLKERAGIVETVYYFYSFGFLVARTLAVTLYGAWVNDESRRPLEYLHSVPSEYYCREISRLIQQINSSPVGITGCNFFMVTRSFLLRLASTIVTFELMYLQFGPLLKSNQLNEPKKCIR